MDKPFKSGYVSIIGRANVGKSTLLNRFIGEKIAIVSDKPQTTRNKVLGILCGEGHQIMFLDTPGIHTPRTRLGEYMVNTAEQTIYEADVIIYIVEPDERIGKTDEKIIEKLSKIKGMPVILAINKIDKIQKGEILRIIEKYAKRYEFSAIIPISAEKNDGVLPLLDEIIKLLPEGPRYYPEDMFTDQPEKQIVAEIIRGVALSLLMDEVPHGIAVNIASMKEKDKITIIGAEIYCEKNSHKAIILGKNGEMIKKIGVNSRKKIEEMLGQKVFLELFVRVKSDWRNSNFQLKQFGYE